MSSVVDDIRKLLQDIIAPDLKAIEARLVALEKSTASEFTAADKLSQFRFAAIHEKLSLQTALIQAKNDAILAEFKTLSTVVASNHLTVLHALDLDRRLERIEKDREPRELQ